MRIMYVGIYPPLMPNDDSNADKRIWPHGYFAQEFTQPVKSAVVCVDIVAANLSLALVIDPPASLVLYQLGFGRKR